MRFTQRLDEIGAPSWIGKVADSHDNAPAETTNGPYETECVYRPTRPAGTTSTRSSSRLYDDQRHDGSGRWARHFDGGGPMTACVPLTLLQNLERGEWEESVVRRDAMPDRQGRRIHFINTHSLSIALKDDAYYRCLATADVLFADGVPLVWLSRLGDRLGVISGDESVRLVRGPSVMREMLLESRFRAATRHLLYGGDQPTLERLLARLRHESPHIVADGSIAPPFGELNAAQVAEVDSLLAEHRPRFLWVGIGTPKQDLLAGRVEIPPGSTVLTVGAAFDFLAGSKKEAPLWLRGSGLEWVHRLASEPRRLTRRYLHAAIAFLLTALHLLRHTPWTMSVLGPPRCGERYLSRRT
jgi:N-acetylglucosaminyldiphosphoundecaprenol N-acetyl-beta-D-mannosaminyltransferase